MSLLPTYFSSSLTTEGKPCPGCLPTSSPLAIITGPLGAGFPSCHLALLPDVVTTHTFPVCYLPASAVLKPTAAPLISAPWQYLLLSILVLQKSW